MIIYVGAIAIMFLFSVMMIDLIKLDQSKISLNLIPIVVIISFIFYLNSELYCNNSQEIYQFNSNKSNDFFEIGFFFFSSFNYLIIGSAIILFLPMIGALIFIKCF